MRSSRVVISVPKFNIKHCFASKFKIDVQINEFSLLQLRKLEDMSYILLICTTTCFGCLKISLTPSHFRFLFPSDVFQHRLVPVSWCEQTLCQIYCLHWNSQKIDLIYVYLCLLSSYFIINHLYSLMPWMSE